MRDNAGTYHLAGHDGRSLALQGQVISATVGEGGSYQLFAGTVLIGQGQLDDTDDPMQLFAAKAHAWSARIDDAMADEASIRAEREAAHNENATAAPYKRTVREIIEMVEAVGGRYLTPQVLGTPMIITDNSMVAVLKNAEQYRINVDVVGEPDGIGWFLELNDGAGQMFGRYHFQGN